MVSCSSIPASFALARNTASAVGERQMLPMQTNRIEVSGIALSAQKVDRTQVLYVAGTVDEVCFLS
jgi:hypothetical protein